MDLEGGQGHNLKRDGEWDEEKKGEAGFSPLLALTWRVVRYNT